MQTTSTSPKRGLDPIPTAPTGLTDELRQVYESWPDRFRTKVQIGEGCWGWTKSKTRAGYGRYGRGGRAAGWGFAHRIAYEFTFGTIPEGMELDHLCRDRACVRPDHLEPVTHEENVRRGRAANVAGVCRSGRHPWTSENIITEPGDVRRCRPCRDEREQAYRPPTGNAAANRTHCPQGHPYDSDNTYWSKKGHRLCRACHREREQRRCDSRKG